MSFISRALFLPAWLCVGGPFVLGQVRAQDVLDAAVVGTEPRLDAGSEPDVPPGGEADAAPTPARPRPEDAAASPGAAAWLALDAGVAAAPQAAGRELASAASQPLASAASQPLAAFAADDDAVDVVVTAPRRMEEARNAGAVAVQVITRSQIEKSGARDAAEVLSTQVGVQIDYGFAGAALYLQGLEPQQSLILIDGERIVGARDGVLDLTRIYAGDIQQIEIVRGPASAAYGSDAMGGVVNIVTRPPDAMPSVSAQGRYGVTRGAREWAEDRGQQGDGWISATGGSEKLRSRLSFGYRHVDPYDLEPSTPSTSADGFATYAALGRLDWLPTERARVPLLVRLSRRNARGIDESAGGAVFDRVQRADDLAVSLSPYLRLSERSALRIVGSYALERAQYVRDQRGDDDGDRYEDAREQQATLRVQSESTLGALSLSAGVELFGQHYRSPRIEELGLRGRASPYGELSWTFHERLRGQFAPSVRVDVDSQYGVNVSPRAAFRIDPAKWATVRATVGRGFRAPSFAELLLDFQNSAANYRVRGNDELRPESSFGASLSTELRPVDGVRITLNAFDNELWDLIDTALVEVVGGEQLFSYVNTKRARTSGLESTLLVSVTKLLTLELAHAWTVARDITQKRALSGRAAQRGSVRAVLGGGARPWTLSARCQLVGARRFYASPDANGVEPAYDTPAYAVVDMRAAYRINALLEPFVSGENLGNVREQNLLLRPTTLYVGLNLSY